MPKNSIVHIYGQHSWHTNAIILGNRKGIMALRNAINIALDKTEGRGAQRVYINDGEGYNIEIQIVENKEIDKIHVPYTADYAQDRSGKNPATFSRKVY